MTQEGRGKEKRGGRVRLKEEEQRTRRLEGELNGQGGGVREFEVE